MVKKYLWVAGIALLIVLVGIILIPEGTRVFALAGERLLGQGKGVVRLFNELGGLLQLTLPRAAAYISDALLVILGALALLFINLLVMVPVQLRVLQRQVRNLDEQLNSLRQEIGQASALMAEAAQVSRSPRGLREEGIVAKSPLGPISPSREAGI